MATKYQIAPQVTWRRANGDMLAWYAPSLLRARRMLSMGLSMERPIDASNVERRFSEEEARAYATANGYTEV